METPEIRLSIIHFCSLDALVSLSQTCTDLRALLSVVDESLVRPKVLKRVPWMTLTPGAGLDCWMDCARLIVTRFKSRTQEPEKWWKNDSNKSIEEIADTRDVEYIDGTCFDGETLPASFDPLFETSDMPVPYGLIRGKYLMSPENEEDEERSALDMTTMERFPEDPERFPFKFPDPPDVWIAPNDYVSVLNGSDWTFRCANSYITVTSKEMFSVKQESERWIVVEEGGSYWEEDDVGEESVYILDKENAVENVLVFEPETSVAKFPPGFTKDYTFFLFPGSQGALRIVCDSVTEKVLFYYLDLANGSEETLVFELGCSDQLLDRSDTFPNAFDPIQNLIIVYRGMLYLNHYGRDLIPFWVDLESAPSAGNKNKYSWRGLCLYPGSVLEDVEELDRSNDGRWVTHIWSECRVVCDLLKFKTYIVRDYGWQKDPWSHEKEENDEEEASETGCVFVGADRAAEKPIFYVFNKPYLFSMDWCLNNFDKMHPILFLHHVSRVVYSLFFEGTEQQRRSVGYESEGRYIHDDQFVEGELYKEDPLHDEDEGKKTARKMKRAAERIEKCPRPMTKETTENMERMEGSRRAILSVSERRVGV